MNMDLTFDDRDEFNRKEVANKISSLLGSDIELSPMVIDGGWGKGKTEFCLKLINLMSEEDSHELIYIDAFKADHANEPLLTVLAEVVKLLPDDESKSGFVEKIIPALRFALKTAGKAGVAHLLRQEAADAANDFDKEIQKVSDKVIDISVESLLEDHVKADQSLKALQTTLKELSAEKPIIIFIDELDRCRPDFAVDLLEVIKHTLDVDGVKFVLITNTAQLKASINHCYGRSVDSQKYLDKFLKFTIQLPDFHTPNGHHYFAVSVTHYKNLVGDSELLKDSRLAESGVLDFIEHVIRYNDISLREVESFVRNFEIYQVLTEGQGFSSNLNFGHKLLRVLGLLLFSLNPSLARSIVMNKSDASEIAKFLGVGQLVILADDRPRLEHHQVIAAMTGQDCQFNSDVYVPEDESAANYLEDLIQDYFRAIGFPPRKGERLGITRDTIETISLNYFNR